MNIYPPDICETWWLLIIFYEEEEEESKLISHNLYTLFNIREIFLRLLIETKILPHSYFAPNPLLYVSPSPDLLYSFENEEMW